MSKPSELPAFVEVLCLCGRAHTFLRDQVLEGLGVSRWRCGACKRRFVIACTPGPDHQPESFWPLFLEQIPSTGETKQDGLSTDGATSRAEPAQLDFQCRCGFRMVGKSQIYGKPVRCPRCAARFILRVGYESDGGRPVPLLEYAEGGAIGQAGS